MEFTLIIIFFGVIAGLIFGMVVKIWKDKEDWFEILKKIKWHLIFIISMFILYCFFSNLVKEKIGSWGNNKAFQETQNYRQNIVENTKVEAVDTNKIITQKSLTEEDLKLANIKILANIDLVQKEFERSPRKENGLYGTIYLFDNDVQVTVSRITNKVSGVYLLSNKYTTSRGIAVGDNEMKIKSLYGEPDSTLDQESFPDEPNCYAYEYFAKNEKMILRFLIDNRSNTIRYIGVRIYSGNL